MHQHCLLPWHSSKRRLQGPTSEPAAVRQAVHSRAVQAPDLQLGGGADKAALLLVPRQRGPASKGLIQRHLHLQMQGGAAAQSGGSQGGAEQPSRQRSRTRCQVQHQCIALVRQVRPMRPTLDHTGCATCPACSALPSHRPACAPAAHPSPSDAQQWHQAQPTLSPVTPTTRPRDPMGGAPLACTRGMRCVCCACTSERRTSSCGR